MWVLMVSSKGGEGALSDTAALAVEGTFTGSIQNQGEISAGIFIQGSHIANVGDAYWSRGASDNPASLSGGFFVAENGSVESTTGHGVHLDEYSRADIIGSIGDTAGNGQSVIRSSAPDRSAIYVHQQADLGLSPGIPAIIAANGGEIVSVSGDAITVDGNIAGAIFVNNGRITAESAGASAVNFLSSHSPLHFIQQGNDSITTGSIMGRAGFNDDFVYFHGGRFAGETIQHVDHLEISTKTTSISITQDFVLPAQTTIVLEPEIVGSRHYC